MFVFAIKPVYESFVQNEMSAHDTLQEAFKPENLNRRLKSIERKFRQDPLVSPTHASLTHTRLLCLLLSFVSLSFSPV